MAWPVHALPAAPGSTGVAVTQRSVRRSGFAEEVLRAYAYSAPCAGSTGRSGVTRWALRQRTCAGTARLYYLYGPGRANNCG